MTQYLSERCFHNYALSDVDLSLALIVCPDAHLHGEKSVQVQRGGDVWTPSSWTGCIQEPMGGPNWSHW